MLLAATTSQAALFFYDGGGAGNSPLTAANWNPDGVPGDFDLAVHNNAAAGAIEITANWSVDSLRMSNGTSVVQNGGAVTISTGFGPDAGLWVGEFGPGQVTYTINDGSISTQDPGDGFFVGRTGGADGVFNLNGGDVAVVGDAHFGLDGTAVLNQSGGSFVADGIQVGRFQSPTADVNLSGDADFRANGLLLLSDGADPFLPAVRSDLTITGSSVLVNAGGLIVRDKGNLNFIADIAGVSPIVLGTAPFELESNPIRQSGLTVDLGAYGGAPQDDLLLIDGGVAAVGSFDGLPEGALVPGSGGRTITYAGGADGFDVVLVGIPEPTTAALLALSLAGLVARHRV
ncbi:MAG: PEP-CTERM sorting domain-containing protein [Planctomycetota bacterium]